MPWQTRCAQWLHAPRAVRSPDSITGTKHHKGSLSDLTCMAASPSCTRAGITSSPRRQGTMAVDTEACTAPRGAPTHCSQHHGSAQVLLLEASLWEAVLQSAATDKASQYSGMLACRVPHAGAVTSTPSALFVVVVTSACSRWLRAGRLARLLEPSRQLLHSLMVPSLTLQPCPPLTQNHAASLACSTTAITGPCMSPAVACVQLGSSCCPLPTLEFLSITCSPYCALSPG